MLISSLKVLLGCTHHHEIDQKHIWKKWKNYPNPNPPPLFWLDRKARCCGSPVKNDWSTNICTSCARPLSWQKVGPLSRCQWYNLLVQEKTAAGTQVLKEFKYKSKELYMPRRSRRAFTKACCVGLVQLMVGCRRKFPYNQQKEKQVSWVCIYSSYRQLLNLPLHVRHSVMWTFNFGAHQTFWRPLLLFISYPFVTAFSYSIGHKTLSAKMQKTSAVWGQLTSAGELN